MIKKFIIVFLIFLNCNTASAGIINGVNVIWFNMSLQPSELDKKIFDYIESGKAHEDCWEPGSILFMRSKPKSITSELIKAAIIDKNSRALKKLNDILYLPYGEAVDGFDGIIVYSEKTGGRYYSMTRGQKKISVLEVNPRNVEIGICVVMPDLVRKP